MKACAFVVGPPNGPGAAVMELARRLDFASVLPYRGADRAERQTRRTPLLFFLCAAAGDPRDLQSVALAIRRSPNQLVRFAPLVCFTTTPSLATIRACIDLGFDDVIAMPLSTTRARQRLALQVDRVCVYFETDTYFGPDRRNRMENEEVHSGRGTGGAYRRIEILRSPLAGVAVVGEEEHVVV